jgi:type II secretion system protein G
MPSITRRYSPSAGFTLLEILVVMAIIGILSALAVGGFTGSQEKSRDSRRKSDLSQIRNALETYHTDKGQYPLSQSGRILGCGTGTACTPGEVWQDDNDTVYMVKLPDDPKSDRDYYYVTDDQGKSFEMYAALENELDISVPKSNGQPSSYSGTDCGEHSCTYGTSSPNTGLNSVESNSNSGGEPEGCGFAGCGDEEEGK